MSRLRVLAALILSAALGTSAWAQPGNGATPANAAAPPAADAPPAVSATDEAPAPAGAPTAEPVPPRRPAPPPGSSRGAPLTPAELALLREVEGDFQRYRAAADDHHRRIRAMLLREFRKRDRLLEQRYDERIRQAQAEKERRHLDVIALLEKFIEEHPAHQEFTPDAMFRLADLYLDAADAAFEAQDPLTDPDAEPVADYGKSLALWRQILDRFPGYRQLAGTLYLLAYYGKVKDERASLGLFLALVCANKHHYDHEPPPPLTREQVDERIQSRTLQDPYADCIPMDSGDDELIQHAWVRGVGDHHFSVPGELDEAIAAYGKVAAVPGASLYPEALYKLAWSYYRRDFLPEAIRHFDHSVSIYDATVARGEQPKLELRNESLQYIAVGLTDPWNGELEIDPAVSLQRAQEIYRGRESEPHVRDVWAALGRAFMDLQAYDQAIDAFYTSVGRPWHLDPDNPVVHQEIVSAFEAKGDKFGADSAAAELATRYAPGTEWYAANEKNREAMENQRRIGERMLYAAARNLHAAATRARQDYVAAGSPDGVEGAQARQEYLDLYARTVDLYRSFINQYPESEHVYTFTFGLGEALFFSERYLESVEHYRWVRDHTDLSRVHFEDAAYSIIQAYEKEAARQVASGFIRDIRVPSAQELAALPRPIQPQPVPDIHLRLQQAWDEYQRMVNDPKTAPQMGLNAGMVSLSYYHLDDALARFQVVLDRFCGTPEAVRAKDGILAIHEGRGDVEAFRQTNERFVTSQCGDQEALALALAQNRSLEFRKAANLFAARRYAEAAKEFYVYSKRAPADDGDRATALYNAAIAYREAGKPKTAIHLLKEFSEGNDPVLRQSPYYLEALRLTALSYQSVYDYDTAAARYMTLYEQAKTANERGLTPPPPAPGEQPRSFEQIKLDALYNAAVLRELDRDFKAAIELYQRYEREETDRRRQDRALWAVARIHRSSGNLGGMVDTYAQWRRKYGADQVNQDDYVFSFYDAAQAYAKRRNHSQADKYRRDTIKAWESRGAVKSTRGAEMAGECDLYFVEREYNQTFKPYRIKSQARTEKQALIQRKALDGVTKKMQDQYLALGRYGVGEYAMAAKVRYGETLTAYAQKLFEMPTPKYVLDLDQRNPDLGLVAKFEEALAQKLAPLAEDAKKEWAEVIELAKQQGVSNQWTRLALENLNQEFPDEYPILHKALVDGTEDP